MGQDTVIGRWAELDRFIAAFETAQSQNDQADLADFLPHPEHPLFQTVLRELVRVDLEFHWGHGRPKRLEEYRDRFRELARDGAGIQEIAFEEYRLRLQAGETPSPAEYQQRFGIAVDEWADALSGPSVPARVTEAVRACQQLPSRLLTQQDGGVDSVGPSSPALAEYAQLLRDFHAGDIETADRLARAFAELPEVGNDFLGFRLHAELGRGAGSFSPSREI